MDLVFSTYLASAYYHDKLWDLAVDSAGSAYATGDTGTGGTSPQFPSAGPVEFTHGQGGTDMYITKFEPATSPDDEAPRVTITEPPDQALRGSSSTQVVAEIVDESSTSASSTPVGLAGELPPGGGTVEGVLPLEVEGANLLTVHAVDAAGNTGGSSVTVYRDLIAPLVDVSPAEGSILGAGPVLLGIAVSDQTETAVEVDGSVGGTISVAGGDPYGTAEGLVSTSRGLAEGANTFVVTATDAVGNATTVQRVLILDSAAPLVTIVEPEDGAIVDTPLTPLVATVEDSSATTVGGHLTATLPPGGGLVSGEVELVEGWNTLVVTATDEAGHVAGDSVDVFYDASPPTVAIVSPLEGALLHGSVDYDALAQDASPGSGVVLVQLFVDGSSHATFADGPYESALDTTLLLDGWHTLTAVATDGVGRTATDEIQVQVDNTPPVVAIVDPAAGSLVAGDIQFTAWAEDAESGLAVLEMRSGGEVPTVTDDSTVYPAPVLSDQRTSVDGPPAMDGPWPLSARAVDAAGNEAFAEILVSVDNSAPEKAILSPADGSRVSGTVPIEVAVEDLNFDFLELYVDGALAATSTEPTYVLEYDTTQRTDGSMSVDFLAYDVLGNWSECHLVVVVDNGGCVALHPSTLNLASKGMDRSITVRVCGFGLSTLLPTEGAELRLCVPGGSAVPSTADFAGDDHLQNVQPSGFADLLLKFDRQLLIASIRAGRLTGAIEGDHVVITLKAGDHVLGEDTLRLVGE